MIQKQESTNEIKQTPHLSNLGVGSIVISKLTPNQTKMIASRSKEIVEVFKAIGITSEERNAFIKILIQG